MTNNQKKRLKEEIKEMLNRYDAKCFDREDCGIIPILWNGSVVETLRDLFSMMADKTDFNMLSEEEVRIYEGLYALIQTQSEKK